MNSNINKNFFNPSKFSEEELIALKENVLTTNHFLGSSIYDYFFKEYDDDLYSLLFDGHSIKLYEQKGERPSIIIGRRGSGKSSYLNYIAKKKKIIPIKIAIWRFIDIVERKIETILKAQNRISTEEVSDIWKLLLIVITCYKVKHLVKKGLLKNFIKGLPLKGIAETSIESFAVITLDKLQKKYLDSSQDFDISFAIKAISKVNTNLDDLEDAVSDVLKKNEYIAVMMMDNPEEFIDSREDIDDISLKSHDNSRVRTIAGLLNLMGRINKGDGAIQARLCIPSEQFFYMKQISSAPKKDFETSHLLHWSSGDLLSILAHRYMIFLTIYKQYRDENRYQQLLRMEIYTREGALEFWQFIFDNTVVNDRKSPEEPIVYLMRHTQLLPRQFIDYLNTMIRFAIDDKSYDLTKVHAKYVKKAVREKENDNASEIISAYSFSYPEAAKMFEIVLPKLPLIVTVNEIKDFFYSTTGAKGIQHDFKIFPQVEVSKNRFLRFLIEVGIYGRVTSQPDIKNGQIGYVNAEYEYTIKGSLGVNDENTLAMHPIFSGNISKNLLENVSKNIIGIHPIETDVDKESIMLM